MKSAIAYACDLTPAGRRSQIDSIGKYASEHDIEVLAWFEDESGQSPLLMRPGVQSLLAYSRPYDLVLCERLQALAHSMKELEPFLAELDRRGVGFDCAIPMWDLASQMCRRRSRNLPLFPAVPQQPAEAEQVTRVRIAKPARLNFEHLVHPAPPSVNLGF